MNNLDLILAVAGPTSPAHSSGTFEIVGVGFSFVMVVLALLALVTAGIGAIFIRFDAAASAKAAAASAKAAAATAKSTSATAAPAVVNEAEDPALIAVIAAAVHSVIGDRAHRIVSIRQGGPGWAQEGRRQIFSSHRVR
jgi:Na+-transporting methylmalonyl-CoA/oxaloacetate decarboxylase gamma subunit